MPSTIADRVRQRDAEKRYEKAHADERREKKRVVAQQHVYKVIFCVCYLSIHRRRERMSAAEREKARAQQRGYAANYRTKHRGRLRGQSGVKRYQYVFFSFATDFD